MPDSTTSVEIAKSNDPEWDRKSIGQRAAAALYIDVTDRRGIKWEFRNCDADVTEEILRDWAEIVNLLVLQSSGLLGAES